MTEPSKLNYSPAPDHIPAAGGIAGPLVFGMLINTGSRTSVAIGYCVGAALMLVAALVQALWGVAAERKPLETVSRPLAFVD